MSGQITGLAILVEMDGAIYRVELTEEERDAVADFLETLHAGEIRVAGPVEEDEQKQSGPATL